MDNDKRESYLNDQLRILADNQEAELLLDFDAAVEEVKEKPYKVKFNGKIYDVPREMPLGFATFFFRYCYKKINNKVTLEVPEDRMMQFIELMFGKEMLRALETSRKAVSIDLVFNKLAGTILAKWGYNVQSNNSETSQKKI
jgi:hypothetical protein